MAEKERLMTIGKVAQATGVTTHTLRYYEQERIVTPTERNRAGYRLYDAEALERLQFVRSAQAIGFTLDDIRTLLSLDAGNAKSPKAEVQGLLKKRLAEVNEKMKDLRRVQVALGRALDQCQSSNGECAIIKKIRPKRS